MIQVEVLYVDGCPNHDETLREVERVVDELGVTASVRSVRIADPEDAERHRFLGSPSVRVDGDDVEPGAETRGDYVLACRVYRTEAGYTGRPDADWMRAALARP